MVRSRNHHPPWKRSLWNGLRFLCRSTFSGRQWSKFNLQLATHQSLTTPSQPPLFSFQHDIDWFLAHDANFSLKTRLWNKKLGQWTLSTAKKASQVYAEASLWENIQHREPPHHCRRFQFHSIIRISLNWIHVQYNWIVSLYTSESIALHNCVCRLVMFWIDSTFILLIGLRS